MLGGLRASGQGREGLKCGGQFGHEVYRVNFPPHGRQLPFMTIWGCRHVQTLVLDLDDLLVHSHWTRGRGWRTFKRPGVEDFIKHMGQFYEIVVFTNQASLVCGMQRKILLEILTFLARKSSELNHLLLGCELLEPIRYSSIEFTASQISWVAGLLY